VIPIFIPPLRERKQDIPLIAEAILKEQQESLNTTPRLTQQAIEVLINYDWPGNVRELKNTLLYALTMANGQSHIEVMDLPDEISHTQYHSECINSLEPSPQKGKLNKDTVQKMLVKYQYDFALTAQALNISRTTLWRYRKLFNL
jgi:transcriptional regulator with PAS, ATPase and Fis domain